MQINKTITPQKEEESSSLTGLTNQELLFMRRPDIDSLTRLELGIYGLAPSYRPCTIQELCAMYEVSHEFIYSLSRLLKKNAGLLFGIKLLPELSKIAQVLQSIRFAIQGKLETQGSHKGLSNLGKDWGGTYNSTNFISQSLEVAGTLLPSSLKSESPAHLTFLCDEVYSGGQAILVTIEAQSMAVLDIKLLEEALTAAAWKERFSILEANNILPSEMVKDQGKAMSSAASTLSEQTLILADTFHAVSYRLGIYYGQLHARLEKAMSKEEQLQGLVNRAVNEDRWFKLALQLEEVQTNINYLLECLEWFEPAYYLILRQLRPFTSKGTPRDKQVAQQAIQLSLDVLALLDIKGLQKHIKHINKLLHNGELLRFLDKVPALYQQWQEQLPQNTCWLWMYYWLHWKKAFQSHNPQMQQHNKQEAQAAMTLLQTHYEQHYPEQVHLFEQTRIAVFANLDTIVQASSLVETFNSILKPFIKSARGQVSQPLLNLVMFFHNHRVFDNRCKRGGKAPIELLTGQALEKNYMDLIMELIQKAFEQYEVTSLKQLHFLVCPKKGEKKKRAKKNKAPLKQQQLANIVTLVPDQILDKLLEVA